MSKEILSQEEIDRLLHAFSSGEVTVEEIRETQQAGKHKVYDFRRPNKFSKDQLKHLQTLHDNFARILSSYLSGYLRATVAVHVSSVEQYTFDEFMRSVPTPTMLTVFSLKPLKGVAVLETNAEFLFPVIDLLLGGPGTLPEKVRELTEIELALARRFAGKLLESLRLAWHDIYRVEPAVESIETNPRLQRIVSPGEVVAVISFQTSVNNTAAGPINLCLPHSLLEPVLANLSSYRQYGAAGEGGEAERELVADWLQAATVNLSVVVGETTITVRDFLQLQEGDVLPLDRRFKQDMDLFVEDELKYKVQAGTLGRFMAVQVTSLAEAGD